MKITPSSIPPYCTACGATAGCGCGAPAHAAESLCVQHVSRTQCVLGCARARLRSHAAPLAALTRHMGWLFPYVNLDCAVLAARLAKFWWSRRIGCNMQRLRWSRGLLCGAACVDAWRWVVLAASNEAAARQPDAVVFGCCLPNPQPLHGSCAALGRFGLRGLLLFLADNCMHVSASCARDTVVRVCDVLERPRVSVCSHT